MTALYIACAPARVHADTSLRYAANGNTPRNNDATLNILLMQTRTLYHA